LFDLEIQKKIDAIQFSENWAVSESARISGCFRQTIYKNSRLLKENGPQALRQTFRTDIHHKNLTAKEVENLVITLSLQIRT